jgi:1,6-anhydro-N-acetylmuramate kinase
MAVDNGGKLTVQGCQIPELFDAFRTVQTAKKQEQKNNWNPRGLSPLPFSEILAGRNTSEYTVQDILCTANAFIAETVADEIKNVMNCMLHDKGRQDENTELLITGSGQLHGLLMNLLSSHLGKRPITPISRLGFSSDCFDAANTAMLTLMAADQIPSNLPSLTGSDTSRPLGRITPGSVSAWQQLLNEMTLSKPAARNLRSAV